MKTRKQLKQESSNAEQRALEHFRKLQTIENTILKAISLANFLLIFFSPTIFQLNSLILLSLLIYYVEYNDQTNQRQKQL